MTFTRFKTIKHEEQLEINTGFNGLGALQNMGLSSIFADLVFYASTMRKLEL